MFDLLTRIAPFETAGPLALAGLAWFGANHAVIGPEIAGRLGDLHHLPRCEADVGAAAEARHAAREIQRKRVLDRRDRLIAEAEARFAEETARIEEMRDNLDLLLEQTPFGGLLQDIVPGLEAVGELGALLEEPPTLDLDGLALPTIPAPVPAPDDDTLHGYCGCLVDTVIARHRADFAAYTASLTIHRPAVVASFPDHLADLSRDGACGGLDLL